jgi:hypothetical protein
MAGPDSVDERTCADGRFSLDKTAYSSCHTNWRRKGADLRRFAADASSP